jgi:hypothetical protein
LEGLKVSLGHALLFKERETVEEKVEYHSNDPQVLSPSSPASNTLIGGGFGCGLQDQLSATIELIQEQISSGIGQI